jgi:hypothetical protein
LISSRVLIFTAELLGGWQAAGKLIKEQVQPILDQYPMGVIDRIILKTVKFGKRAPEILGRFSCVNYFHLVPFFGFFTTKFLSHLFCEFSIDTLLSFPVC